MKKILLYVFATTMGLILFCSAGRKGGDFFELYVNGKQVVQHLFYGSQKAPFLNLATAGDNDRVEVLYSHCGRMGTNRRLIFRNEKDVVVKTVYFPNATSSRSLMAFYKRDLSFNLATVRLYYASDELPAGRLLADLSWQATNATAKRK
jgi:hypothetical protein